MEKKNTFNEKNKCNHVFVNFFRKYFDSIFGLKCIQKNEINMAIYLLAKADARNA